MPHIKPRILLTAGEPAGVGPDLIVYLAQQLWSCELIVIADPLLLKDRARHLNLPLTLTSADLDLTPSPNAISEIKIIPVALKAATEIGKLNSENSSYVLATLQIANDLCINNLAQAIVTGPVHKGIMNEAGISFSGHTEFFAEQAHANNTVMLFVVRDEHTNYQIKVALATTHISLKNVAAAITTELLEQQLRVLHTDLQKKFHIQNPRILLCGLNPHAGENGYLGREEIEVITPIITKLNRQGFNLAGPLPADTIFTRKLLSQADAILAMYHDQALPVVKYIGFANAVNVTLGLPYLRTSVDHGTALDVAGTDQVDTGSMLAAVNLAIEMVGKIK